VGETVTRIPPPEGDDQAAIDAYIAEVWRASEAGELLEEIPPEEVEGMDEVWDELNVRWGREEHAAAIVQRRRDRRRRRAWGVPAARYHLP
jgi:hypothetical protein